MLPCAAGCLIADLAAQSGPPPMARPGVALTNATVIDVRTGTLRPGVTVVIDGHRIAAVGPVSRVPVPTRAVAVDATGKYVIPGLADTHFHYSDEWATSRLEPAAYFGWILAGGVTSVREMSQPGLARVLDLRREAVAGRMPAPRIHVSAGLDASLDAPWATLFRRAGTRDAGAALRRLPAAGIDGLKLHNCPRQTMLEAIGAARAAGVPVYGHTVFGSADRPPVYENFTLDLVRAGLNGVVHALGTVRPAGVDDRSAPDLSRTTVEGRRAWRVHNLSAWTRVRPGETQTLIREMVARRVWYEPTRLVDYYWNHQDRYESPALPATHPYRTRVRSDGDAETRAAVAALEAAEAAFIRQFYEAGGLLLAGTDEAPFPPFGVSEEMRLLVEAGVPPHAALQAATINAARAMRSEDRPRLGSVDVGKLADLVVLDANPLMDITNVRTIHAVVADGRLFDRAALDELVNRGARQETA